MKQFGMFTICMSSLAVYLAGLVGWLLSYLRISFKFGRCFFFSQSSDSPLFNLYYWLSICHKNSIESCQHTWSKKIVRCFSIQIYLSMCVWCVWCVCAMLREICFISLIYHQIEFLCKQIKSITFSVSFALITVIVCSSLLLSPSSSSLPSHFIFYNEWISQEIVFFPCLNSDRMLLFSLLFRS